MIKDRKPTTISTHNGIEADIENYNLYEPQKLIRLPSKIIQELQNETGNNNGKKNTIAKKFMNYQMLFIGRTASIYHKLDLFIAVPQTPINLPIVRPQNPDIFIQNPNYCIEEKLKNTGTILFLQDSKFQTKIYTSWLEISLRNNKIVNINQQHTKLEQINTEPYLLTYGMRKDNKIGFFCAKIISEDNLNQIKKYLKQFKK